MHLKWGPLDLTLEHTSDMRILRVPDPTGLDTLWYEARCAMVAQFNPFATASNSLNANGRPFDNLQTTLNQFKASLQQDRQQLTLTVGGGRVYTAPVNDGAGNPYPCDPMGGPFLDDLQVVEFLADKSATVLLRFRFAFSDVNSCVVSNRWTTQSYTDPISRLSRRTISGRAFMRQDFLNSFTPPAVPDQLRAAFVFSTPPNFQRGPVTAVATPDGAELAYQVVDFEKRLNLGAQSVATEIEGDSTAGVDFPFSEVKGAVSAIGTFLSSGEDLGKGNLLGALGKWAVLVPTAKARVVTRVRGDAKADLATLSQIAINCCVDRFAPLSIGNLFTGGKALFPVSGFLSTSHNDKGPASVQAKFEFLPITLNAFKAMWNPQQVAAMLNLNASIFNPNGAPIGVTDPAAVNPALPSSNSTRGHWLAFLVGQILKQGGAVPGLPNQNDPARREFVNTF